MQSCSESINTLKHLNQTLLEQNAQFAIKNEELKNNCDILFERFAQITEYRNDKTGKHINRVSNLSARIALRMGMPEPFIHNISQAACLHDLGKVGIPDTILLKPAKLTHHEYKIVQQHCQLGAELLSNTGFELLDMAQKIALSHHEKLDGSGYPHNLTNHEIPIEAKIVAVVDVYDTLCSKRPYKNAWKSHEALEVLENAKGRHFDGTVVDTLREIVTVKTVKKWQSQKNQLVELSTL